MHNSSAGNGGAAESQYQYQSRSVLARFQEAQNNESLSEVRELSVGECAQCVFVCVCVYVCVCVCVSGFPKAYKKDFNNTRTICAESLNNKK